MVPESRSVLIVGRPQRDGGVVLQSPHLMPDLRRDLLEVLVVGGVHAAGEHEVLPDLGHDSIGKFKSHKGRDSFQLLVEVPDICLV